MNGLDRVHTKAARSTPLENEPKEMYEAFRRGSVVHVLRHRGVQFHTFPHVRFQSSLPRATLV